MDGVLLKDSNVQAGASGTAGNVVSFPATAAKGTLKLAAADSAGDTETKITNASQAAARIYTVPDGGADANFVLSEGASTLNALRTFGDGIATDTIAEETGAAGVTVDGVLLKDGAVRAAGSSATGALLAQFGKNSNEGLTVKCMEETVACSAIENPMTNPVPKGAIILLVQANAEAALTGGGTTATWSLGVTGDVDSYGTAGFPTQADSLAQNSKSNFLQNLDTAARLAADETIKVCAAATGGAAAGDTALTVGSVRVQVVFLHWDALENAA